MDIILLQDVEKVGEKHTIVTVKPGYARNYLIPQGLAIVANASNRGKLTEMRRRADAQLQMRKDEAQAMADKLADKVLKIGAKAGTSGKIFGSVTNVQIASALEEQFGIQVDRKIISIPEEVKTLGNYQAKINLHKEVDININFEVIGE